MPKIVRLTEIAEHRFGGGFTVGSGASQNGSHLVSRSIARVRIIPVDFWLSLNRLAGNADYLCQF